MDAGILDAPGPIVAVTGNNLAFRGRLSEFAANCVAASMLVIGSLVFIWVRAKYGEIAPILLGGVLGLLSGRRSAVLEQSGNDPNWQIADAAFRRLRFRAWRLDCTTLTNPCLLNSEWQTVALAFDWKNTCPHGNVTGGSQGREAGFSKAFLDRGYNVAASALESTTSNAFEASDKRALVDGNIAAAATAAKIAEVANNEFKWIDALVNHAGVHLVKHFTDYTLDEHALAAVKQMLAHKRRSRRSAHA